MEVVVSCALTGNYSEYITLCFVTDVKASFVRDYDKLVKYL